MTSLVCIPTYNEAASIREIVYRTLNAVPSCHVLIADDGSPDGTGEIADELATSDTRVHVLHRPEKAGLGAAYLAAFAWGLARGYSEIVEMDADGSHRPEELPRLLSGLTEADLVIGSRWIAGGQVQGWPFLRRMISRSGSRYARLALGLAQHDATSGFRAYRATAILRIAVDRIRSEGYSFQIEMLRRAALADLRVTEVPITFTDRQLGTSKMSGRIVAEALLRVTAWGISDFPRRGKRARQSIGDPLTEESRV